MKSQRQSYLRKAYVYLDPGPPRQEILQRPFPAHWVDILHAECAYYAWLTAIEKEKLQNDLRFWIAEKSWEGCGSLAMTETIQVTIAAFAR